MRFPLLSTTSIPIYPYSWYFGRRTTIIFPGVPTIFQLRHAFLAEYISPSISFRKSHILHDLLEARIASQGVVKRIHFERA